MKKTLLLALLPGLAGLLLLAACGQTGPLYLPENDGVKNAGEETQDSTAE